MGIAGLVVAMAPTLGPAFGGIVTFYLNWRYIFVFVTIFAVIVFFAGLTVIGKYHEQSKNSFDWLSFIVLAVSFMTLTIGVNQIGNGIANPLLWILLVVTVVLIGGFVKLSKWSSKNCLI